MEIAGERGKEGERASTRAIETNRVSCLKGDADEKRSAAGGKKREKGENTGRACYLLPQRKGSGSNNRGVRLKGEREEGIRALAGGKSAKGWEVPVASPLGRGEKKREEREYSDDTKRRTVSPAKESG